MAFPFRTVVIGGLLFFAATVMLGKLGRERRHSEDLREKALEDSFPASDAPATQDFAIPVNRQ